MTSWQPISDRSNFPAFGEPCFVRCANGHLTIAAPYRDERDAVVWSRVGTELFHLSSVGWMVDYHKASWQVHPTHYMRFPVS